MLSPQEISDRMEIGDLLARYCDAIDRQDFEALDSIFAPDAWIDFTASGGSAGGLVDTKRFLTEALANFSSTEHLLGLPVVELDGDRARVRTPCHNPMVVGEGEDRLVLLYGLWYLDELVRTGEGWRITRREQKLAYSRRLSRTVGGASDQPLRVSDRTPGS